MSAPSPAARSLAQRVLRRGATTARRAWWILERAPACTAAWLRDRRARRFYRHLTESDIRATRRSDTVFVFGSGYSLNDISPAEWQAIARHDTVGFNEFHRQPFVRTDYHVAAEVDFIEPYAAGLRDNPLYAGTVLVVQEGWRALFGNTLVGERLLRPGTRVFRFRRRARGVYQLPSRTFSGGLVHGFGSIIGVVNFAFLMEWRHIVIAGVDLNDRRYFWLPADQMRPYDRPGFTVDSVFGNADNIVSMLGAWRDVFASEGVSLSVYNPRSRLARVLPVFTFSPTEVV